MKALWSSCVMQEPFLNLPGTIKTETDRKLRFLLKNRLQIRKWKPSQHYSSMNWLEWPPKLVWSSTAERPQKWYSVVQSLRESPHSSCLSCFDLSSNNLCIINSRLLSKTTEKCWCCNTRTGILLLYCISSILLYFVAWLVIVIGRGGFNPVAFGHQSVIICLVAVITDWWL